MAVQDGNGQIVGGLQPLNLPGGTACDTSEDARLIACGGSLYAVYNAEVSSARKPGQAPVRMFLAELDTSDLAHLHARWARQLTSERPSNRHEKNWTPFCHEDQLYFIEQTVPHLVSALPAEELARAQGAQGASPLSLLHLVSLPAPPPTEGEVVWEGGPWRGGTPAVYEPSLNEYVSFFHSHLASGKSRLYYAGFYSFEAQPPFAICRYVPAPIALPAVTSLWHRRSRIVFPMGLIDQGEEYLVSYGQDDRSLGLATIDKATLLGQLISLP